MTVRGRSRFWACPPAVVVLVVAIVIGVRAQSAQSLSTCTDAQLVPRVAELLVSQGAPGYTATGFKLARGKETIVRAYLTTPTGCTLANKQSITPISATLDTAYSNGATGSAAQLTNYAPLSGKVTSATPLLYSTSDPIFVAPGSYMAPAPTKFDVKFTLKVTYSRNGSSTYNQTAATDPNAATTVTVDQKTNALRVLVVPMGDPTDPNPQWSSAADSTFQSVMTNVARAYPVPSGATPSLNSTTGIRYLMSTTLLNAKSLNLYTNGKFCGTGANWATSKVTDTASPLYGHTLKGDLLQRLADYNDPLKNNIPADIVLGVIDGNIAGKSSDGCDDGRAATPASGSPGQVGWVRIDTGSYPSPVPMELLHPFGISRTISFHSSNVEADGAEPDHGYNVILRKVIATATGALGTNDHSIMNYNTSSIPYTKDNTLLEPADWKEALCDLGGFDSTTPVPFANCTLSTALGTTQGVAAGHVFYQVSGILTSSSTVRVTMAKANQSGRGQTGVVCKNVDEFDSVTNPLPSCLTNDSTVHLLLCTGECSTTNFNKDVGLAVLPDEGHDAAPPDPNSPPDPGGPNGFGALVEMNGNWTDAALKVNGTLVPLGSSNDPNQPVILNTDTGSAPTILRSFPMPVAGNGRAIAFDGASTLYTTLASGTTVYKQSTTDGTQTGTLNVGTTTGALAYNAGHLYGGAYDGSSTGNVYDFNLSNNEKTPLFSFNDTRPCLFGGQYIDGLEYRPTANNFAVSGDACNTVYIETSGGIEVSHFATTNNSGITTDGAGGLWLALLTHGDSPYTELTHVDASGNVLGSPIILSGYAAEDLAYDNVTFGSGKCAVWMNEATFTFGVQPQIRAVAVPCGGGSADTSNGGVVAVQTENAKFVSLFFTCRNSLTGPPSDDDPPIFPLANGLQPGSSGEVAAVYSAQLFCGGTGESPKIISEASNGWASTGLTDSNVTAPVSAPARAPIVSIASPLNGAKYRRLEFVHYEGSATDAQENAITGDNLKWYDGNTPIRTGQSFDLKLTSTAALGNHTIKLVATDVVHDKTDSATVTISVGPALCPSTSKCP
jgi:hypothetical protein